METPGKLPTDRGRTGRGGDARRVESGSWLEEVPGFHGVRAGGGEQETKATTLVSLVRGAGWAGGGGSPMVASVSLWRRTAGCQGEEGEALVLRFGRELQSSRAADVQVPTAWGLAGAVQGAAGLPGQRGPSQHWASSSQEWQEEGRASRERHGWDSTGLTPASVAP